MATPIFNIQDIRVDSTVELPEVPATSTLFEMVYIYKSDNNTELTQITSQAELELAIPTADELKNVGYFGKTFYVLGCADGTSLAEQIAKIGNLAFTIVWSKEAAGLYLAQTTKPAWVGFMVFNVVGANPWTDTNIKTLASTERMCVYSTPENDNKAWEVVTALLNDVRGYPYLGKVVNYAFTSQTSNYDKRQRDLLMGANISFAVNSLQGVKNFDLYAGGVQMRAVMGLYIAQFEFDAVYEENIDADTEYTDTQIGKIEAEIINRAQQLKDAGIIRGITLQPTTVGEQDPANAIKGILILGNKEVSYDYRLSVIKYKIQGVI